MLSAEGPSGLSSSCQASALIGDERSLAGDSADPSARVQNQLPQFSIRDYVFTVRNKDIRRNWPFPQRHLQLCLKHGISVVLPPFEPPNSVRSHCCLNREESDKLLTSTGCDTSGIEPDDLTRKETSCSFDILPDSNPLTLEAAPEGEILGKGKQKSAFKGICNVYGGQGKSCVESIVRSPTHTEQSNLDQSRKCSLLANERILKASAKVEVCKPSLFGKHENVKEPAGKKFKLIVKLGTNPELGHADEVSSNSSMISDSMASKICPVCKTFSSTSNTTLNAHIDQCLSMKSDMDQITDIPSVNKVKPTKKRLMVDIYETASPCTLEDLDRRNGTSWALDLASLALASEVCADNKRHKVSSMDQVDEESGKGAVYVDSDGTKVCILSKLNVMTPSTLVEPSTSKLNKSKKENRHRIRLDMGKESPLLHKHVKAIASTKREGSLALLKDLIQEESNIGPICDVVDSEAQPLSEKVSLQNKIRSKVTGTLKRVLSTNNSDIAEKRNDVVPHNACEKHSITPSPVIRSGHSHPTRTSALRCIELSPSADFTSTPKLKTMNMLSNSTVYGDSRKKQSLSAVDNGSSHLTNDFFSNGSSRLKWPKESQKLISLPRRKKRTSHMNEKSDKFPNPRTDASEGFHSLTAESQQAKLRTVIKKPLLPSYSNHRRKKLILKKIKKQISTKRTCSEDLSPSNECIDRNNYGAMPANKTDAIFNCHFSDQSTVLMSELKLPCTYTGKDGKYGYPERFQLEREQCNSEAVMELQTERSDDLAIGTKSSFHLDHPTMDEHLVPEGLLAVSDSSLKSWSRLVENDSFVSGREVWADTNDPRSFNHQMMHCENETSNKITGSDNKMLVDAGFKGVADVCPKGYYMECKTNAQQVLGLSTCQSSSANIGVENPQGNSSMTSIRITPNNDHNVAADSGHCASPISGTSNVSHPSTEELKEHTSEQVIGERSVDDGCSRRSKFVNAWEPRLFFQERCTGQCRQENSRMTMDWHPTSYWGIKPCCCSRREAVCLESEVSRRYMVPEMTLPPNVKHTSLNFTPSSEMVLSAFGVCPRDRTQITATEMEQSPPEFSSRKVHTTLAESYTPCRRLGYTGAMKQQTSPNPVLRLMGKDVMVVNNDEARAQHQNAVPFSSGCPSTCGEYPSSMLMHHQSMDGWKYAHSTPTHPAATALDCMPPLYGCLDTHAQQSRLARFDSRESAHPPYQGPRPSNHVSYQTREVIVIEDSEAEVETENGQPSPASRMVSTIPLLNSQQAMPSSCFHSHYSPQTREMPGRLPNNLAALPKNPSEGRDRHNPSHSQPMLFYFQSQ